MKKTATSRSTSTQGRYRIHPDDDPEGVGDGGRPSPGLPSGRRPGDGSDGGRLMAAPREAGRPSSSLGLHGTASTAIDRSPRPGTPRSHGSLVAARGTGSLGSLPRRNGSPALVA